jgi:hypothetical protein
MYPGDDPASMHKSERTNDVMAQASGKRTVNLILDRQRRHETTIILICKYVREEEVNGRKTYLIFRAEKM